MLWCLLRQIGEKAGDREHVEDARRDPFKQTAVHCGFHHIAEKKVDAQVFNLLCIVVKKQRIRTLGMCAAIQQSGEVRRQMLHIAQQKPKREKVRIGAPHSAQTDKLTRLQVLG